MIDSLIRPTIESTMDKMAVKVAQSGLSANKLTLIGFIIGFFGCFLVAMQLYIPGLLFILIALFFDGLDGAVARMTQPSELGAYLDMMSGVTLFALFPFLFMLSQPQHSMAAGILLFGLLLMGIANLSYDYFARNKGAEAAKSGLVETSEITLFIILSCIYPAGFSFFAGALALLSLTAAIMRVTRTVKLLKI